MLEKTNHNFRVKEKDKFSIVWDSVYYYVIAWILLSIYGGRACPFVDGVTFTPVFIALGAFIAGIYIIRVILLYFFPKVILSSTTKYFLFELVFFVLWGIAGTIWGLYTYNFHTEGVVKMLFGSIIPGVFFSIEMINTRERYLIYRRGLKTNSPLTMSKFVSLRRKVLLFGVLSIGMAGVAIVLVTYKNFIWTAANVLILPESVVIASVLKETLMVIGIFLGLVIKLIANYSQNLSLYFYMLVRKLDQIAEGKYDDRVPVFSNDEFSLLIHHVNDISGELEEKQKIKSIFGKIMSPSIAKRLMSSDKLELGGFQDDVVVMFMDIRNFTTFSEHGAPADVVKKLNNFLTRMVEVIMKHDGIIDKFLGDGIMAIFGIEKQENICGAAVSAAVEMQEIIAKEFANTGLMAGIGLHKGSAIIGMVGSPERLEFTVIGDTVNTASRIESATKVTKKSVLISNAVYQELNGQQKDWSSIGYLQLKGKEQKIRAFAHDKLAAL